MKMLLSLDKPIHYYRMDPIEEATQLKGVVVEVTEEWYDAAQCAINAYDAVMDTCHDLLRGKGAR